MKIFRPSKDKKPKQIYTIHANWLNLWAASGPPIPVHSTGNQFPATTAFWKYPENHRWSLEHKVCKSSSHQETETISCQTLSKIANRKNCVQPGSWHSSLRHHQMIWTWKWLFFLIQGVKKTGSKVRCLVITGS